MPNCPLLQVRQVGGDHRHPRHDVMLRGVVICINAMIALA
jgi:hypothetical protein